MSTPLSGRLCTLSITFVVDFITLPLPPCRASATECGVGEALVGVVELVIVLLKALPRGPPQLMRHWTSLRSHGVIEDKTAIVTMLVLLGISLFLLLTLPIVQSLLFLMSLQASLYVKPPSELIFALNAPQTVPLLQPSSL